MVLYAGCDNSDQEEIVPIPGKAFLDALIANGADLNGDGLISYPEAEATEAIVLPPSGITDLNGLETFVNLDSLTITLNPLGGINLSANTSLSYLEVTSSELTHLDISANHLLETLICGRNRLTEIDFSNNPALTTLIVNNNLLASLELSSITSLSTMISCGNQLGYLDISMHAELTKIGVDNMPMLAEVCVWTLPFPPEGIIVLQDFSPNIQYTTGCSR
jgi:hypothetical protein